MPETPAETTPADDFQPHKGLHHFAACGEYRPVAGNFECLRCRGECPCRLPNQPAVRPSTWGGGAR